MASRNDVKNPLLYAMILTMKKEMSADNAHATWKQVGAIVVLAVAMYLIAWYCKGFFAEVFGYTATITETTTNRGGTVAIKDISTSLPEQRFLRDALIGVVALATLLVTLWRTAIHAHDSKVAERRSQKDEEQARKTIEIEEQKTQIERSRFLDGQFVHAKQMLTKQTSDSAPSISARAGGIHAMAELANTAPDIFVSQTVKILVAYIKDNVQITASPRLAKDKLPDAPRILGEDVKAAFDAVDNLFTNPKTSGISAGLPLHTLDFSHANFSHLDLSHNEAGGLHRYKWERTDLSGTNLQGANLENAHLLGAILHGADLSWAQLGGATLLNAELDGATLANAFLHVHLGTRKPAPVEIHGASLRWAQLGGAINFENWRAKYFATDFSDATIDEGPTEEEKPLLAGKIWCAGVPELAEVVQQQEDEWNLESCPSTSALMGALRNFSELNPEHISRACAFRKAVARLDHNGDLPTDLPDSWDNLLANIRGEWGDIVAKE